MDSPAVDIEITSCRVTELIRWHGTDESNLPPAHTLQNLSRDTVAALRDLERYRQSAERLRVAMARAFWAQDLREVRSILLEALGCPPEDQEFEDAESRSLLD